MYDELIKRMRICAAEAGACKACELDSNPSCTDYLMKQAADVIEKLQKDLERSKEYEAFLKKEANEALRKFQVAISSKPRWIPVTERLPEKDGAFITAYSKGGVSQNWYMTFHHGGGKWYQNSEDTGEVTHWMPLPQPPKEE